MVGDMIKKYRTMAGLTQKELSEKIGISRGYLATLETNKNVPTKAILNTLADIFDISVNVFLNDPTEISEIENKKTIELIKNLIKNTENKKIKWESFLRRQTPFDNYISNNKDKYEDWQQEGMIFTEVKNKFYLMYPTIIDVSPDMFEPVFYNFIQLVAVYYDKEFKFLELGNSRDFIDIEGLYRLANPEIMGKVNILDDLLNDMQEYDPVDPSDDVPF
ncbi:helix-turn-helix transcriptional regulator [Peptostreptococcus porci]|uniref:helix-turn-helix domain-containing protein n=1 Tax=Peptostreptococcus porci TaxID=2652282 RepID=UPI002A9139C3|nr:helix-turn-helix transcriptional regulator [Peptostreptococcus porci]MDY5435806.1 helix-turn-helix transcriptional regulator [Peptostreptococcus porci]